jgi:hypothetical protein
MVEYRDEWKCRDILVVARTAVSFPQIRIQPSLTTIKKRRMKRKSYGIVLKTVPHKKDTMIKFGEKKGQEI